jgi:trimeric autotransporter adhesin
MGRLKATLLAVISVAAAMSFTNCGGSSNRSTGPQFPAKITLLPTSGSIDVGGTLAFSATARDRSNNILGNVVFTFTSSNPAVLTVSNTGVACAGTWDSLTSPRVCTPGGAGVADVTVAGDGVTSSPVHVFVHQHIDTLKVSAVPPTSGSLPPGPGNCFTANTTSTTTAQSETLQATAFNGATDITSTVGPVSWTAVTPAVVNLTPLKDPAGNINGQLQVAAKTPGTTQIFASVGNSNSVPQPFTTCPVQAISFLVNGVQTNTINAPISTAQKIDALATDTAGNNLPTAPLTWTASNLPVVGGKALPTAAATISISGSTPGGTSITASCIPPNCNINLSPMQAIYPTAAIQATFTGAPSTTAPTVDVSSTGCGTTANCTSAIVAISGSNNAVSNPIALTGTPNSFRFGLEATSKAFLGSEEGLNTFNPATAAAPVTSNALITGKVLAVSPDGNSVVVSETSPGVFNQVFILNTGTNGTLTTLPISGAVAAAFSPDNLKLFIATSSGKLFVFSTQAALQQNITLPNLAPPNSPTDIAFNATGGFAAVAGPGGLSFLSTCDNPSAPAVTTAAAPGSIAVRALPNGSFITLAPPNIEVVPITQVTNTGCIQTPTAAAPNTANLGQGNFTPVDFLVSGDGNRAYIPIQGSSSVLVFDIGSSAVSSIALVGNPSPVSAALTPDGAFLYVGASDGAVHKLDTSLGTDVAQIPIAANTLCVVPSGPAPACLPDLVQVRP